MKKIIRHHSNFPYRIITGVFLSAIIGFSPISAVAGKPGSGSKTPLDPASQPEFVNTLPNPLDSGFVLQPSDTIGGEPFYEVSMKEISQNLGLINPQNGKPLLTNV